MSNTGYLISDGKDLDALYKARVDTKGADVGYLNPDGVDLSNLYQWQGREAVPISEKKSGYLKSDSVDLSDFFQSNNAYYGGVDSYWFTGMCSYGDFLYVGNRSNNTIDIIRKNDMVLVDTYNVGVAPNGIRTNGIYVWFHGDIPSTYVYKIILNTRQILTINVSPYIPNCTTNMELSGDHLYIPCAGSNAVVQMNVSTNAIENILTGANGACDVCVVNGYLFVVCSTDDAVKRVNLSTSEVYTKTVGDNPRSVFTDGEYVWVCNWGSDSVTKIHIDNLSLRTIITGPDPAEGEIQGDYIWFFYYQNNVARKLNKSDFSSVLNITLSYSIIKIIYENPYVYALTINYSGSGKLYKIGIQ